MSTAIASPPSWTISDRVFVLVALLHRAQPNTESFSKAEIVALNRQLGLVEDEQSLSTHISSGCVASVMANPNTHKMLTRTSRGYYRLLLPGDDVHPTKVGASFPDPMVLPIEYRELVEWAERRYGGSRSETSPIEALMSLAGTGRKLFVDESVDALLARLRGPRSGE